MANQDTPVIRLEDVSFAYNGEDVLSNVNLTVRQDDFLAIVGPNGGGKTTLVKLILGLLAPRRGSVRVMGRDPAASRPNIGYVPQNATVQPQFPITVLDVVLMGLEHSGRHSARQSRELALNTLRLVAMADYQSRRFGTLSGGQKQRVLVARALISQPSLLLFDEPTANIDPQGKVCLFDMLATLSSEITVVLVSHDLISASGGITSVAVVNRQLIQRRDKTLTPDMLQLIYGAHDASCPLGDYLKFMPEIFDHTIHEQHRHD